MRPALEDGLWWCAKRHRHKLPEHCQMMAVSRNDVIFLGSQNFSAESPAFCK